MLLQLNYPWFYLVIILILPKVHKKSFIKRIAHILVIIVSVLIALVLLIYILLWLPPVQQKIKDIALKEVMKITGSKMSVDKLHFRPFNQIILKNIYVEDLKGDTLLFANKLSVGFDLFKILDNHLLIKSIDLDDFVANVYKDSVDSDFNFQFLIDAFSSGEKDTTSTSSMSIQINDIKIKDGRVNYDILSEETLSDSIFDFNHIHIRDFQSDIDLNSIDIENLDASINNLVLFEKSGLSITNGQVKITSDQKRIEMKDLKLDFSASQISIPNAWVDYTGLELADLIKGGSYYLKLGENHIVPSDFHMFYPDINKLSDQLTFTGEAEGKLPEIQVPTLQANYGDHIKLDLAASMDDFNEWQNTPVQLDLNELSIDSYGIEEIMNFSSDTQNNKIPVKVGFITLNGHLEGRLPELTLQLIAQSDRGSISLDGSGGYEYDSGAATFDANLTSNNFDLETLMRDTTFGMASLQLQAKGNISGSGYVNANANVNISRFDFLSYSYNSIQANGSYIGDSIQLNLTSGDPNLPIYLSASANLGDKIQAAKLYFKADLINVDTLKLIPNYGDVILSTVISADVQGFNPEKMNANLYIDSLYIHTHSGTFNEPQLKISYQAADSSSKVLNINSRIIKANARGQFTYNGIMESLAENFPMLFPDKKLNPKNKDNFAESLNFVIGMNDINSLSDLLKLPQAIPDSILFMGRYNNDGQNMRLSASAYTLFTESDTTIVNITLRNLENNKLGTIVNLDNKSSNYDFDGGLDAEVEFIPKPGSSMPDMDIVLNSRPWVLNETDFDLNPAKIEIRENRYVVHNLSLSHADDPNEYIKLNGAVTASREDSLTVDISHFQFGTIFGAIKADMPLSGEANGTITARSILATPFVFTRNLAINNIVFAKNEIGDINIRSGWSSERNGLALRATLDHPNRQQSVITGFALPERDSISLNAKIRDIRMEWLGPLASGALYGLDGSLGANVRVNGKMQSPSINGTVYFDQAKMGVSMLNTLYSFSDSIYIKPDRVELKKFTIRDENSNRLVADGRVTHRNFGAFNPNVSISFNNFLVMNNEQQKDSLFYGNLKLNGQLKLTQSNNDFLLSGNISHTDDAKIMVNIPSSASAAQRYNFITYVDSAGRPLDEKEGNGLKAPSFAFPFRINISLNLNSNLHAGAVYNRATGDAVEASGNGTISFIYDLETSNMNLSGDYTLESGKASLSLLNITTKTFTVQPGSKLTFRGDPLNTSFNVTALYTVRADLTTLDPAFAQMNLSRTRVPVTVAITATGSMDNLNLKYDVTIPNQTEEVQRRVSGLLYTDDIKIRQIAYLLATGGFMPPNSNNPGTGGNLLTTVGSSALSTALNSALAGVLKDNWTIGTELRAGEDGFSDMDVDVNISTQLFDDRLTINGTIGYTNDQNLTNNNLTGDFDAEYKLIQSGNIVLKAYNKTNNKYYETAPYTQGIGVVYKRSALTFRKLFDRLNWRRNKEKDEFEVSPVIPEGEDEATDPDSSEAERDLNNMMN